MCFSQGKHKEIHSFKTPSYWHVLYFLYHITHFFLANIVQNSPVPCGQNYSTAFIRVSPSQILLELLFIPKKQVKKSL